MANPVGAVNPPPINLEAYVKELLTRKRCTSPIAAEQAAEHELAIRFRRRLSHAEIVKLGLAIALEWQRRAAIKRSMRGVS